MPLGSRSVDPLIFADPDPDPGSQNLADPTDPDPKHCLKWNLDYSVQGLLFCDFYLYFSLDILLRLCPAGKLRVNQT